MWPGRMPSDQGGERGAEDGERRSRRESGEAACGERVVAWLGTRVERGEQAQVVEAGDAAVEQADDGEPDVAGVDGGGEDVELAEEAAGEGNADQREQEEGEQRGEHGAA